ncbi:hypothetical protein ACFLU4_09045 [Chloroflexota bacterium]
MDIEYELTIADLVEFNLNYLANSPAQQKARKSGKWGLIALASLFMLFAIVWIFLLTGYERGYLPYSRIISDLYTLV